MTKYDLENILYIIKTEGKRGCKKCLTYEGCNTCCMSKGCPRGGPSELLVKQAERFLKDNPEEILDI